MNAMANFAAQSRTVTQGDYLARIYSLPSRFGSIAKAQVVPNSGLKSDVNKILLGKIDRDGSSMAAGSTNNDYFRNIAYDTTNPFAINVYLLSYDANKNLTSPNAALVTNLITHLKHSRMLTDGVNIIDGYIVNIGVEFAITVYKGFNKKEVLSNCIAMVQQFFNIDQWTFSQTISLSRLNLEIAKVDGVQSVVKTRIYNKTVMDGNYSPVEYDIDAATKDGIIYPSVDPSIFEVKYPNSDIRGSYN
jgi:hypothetical protein